MEGPSQSFEPAWKPPRGPEGLLGRQSKEGGATALERAIDRLSERSDEILEKAFSVLSLRYKHEEKIRKILDEINFNYLESILKKIVQNSAHAAQKEYADFQLTPDSVGLDPDMSDVGTASWEGELTINPVRIGKAAKKDSLSDGDLKQAVTIIVAHEALHLLAIKPKVETGFTKVGFLISANEAMTDMLARAVGSAYQEFTNTENTEKRRSYNHYQEDINYLIALIALIARDNRVSIDLVIQAFTTSYFFDNSVLDGFSDFPNISKDARAIVNVLHSREATEKAFDIKEFNFDPETKALLANLINTKQRDQIVRSALHI